MLTGLAAAGVLRHALIVGANDGGGALDPLRYAELDAQRMAEVLVDLGGFEAPYITVLYAPTAEELKDAIRSHAQMAGSFDEDLFLFYYSGHADARGLRLDAELYTFETLKADIRNMPAEMKLGVLDACRSGTITRLKGAQVTAPFLVQEELPAEGEAWMTATSADEEAQESDQLRGSFFTHYLLSGLRGAADSGDGEVSLDEAYRYAFDRVVDRTGGTEAGAQHPNFDYKLKGQGDVPLTAVSEGRAQLSFPPETGGQITVLRMPDRTPVAEVVKAVGAPSTLALPPGNYLLRLREADGRTFREALVGLNDGARLTHTRWGGANAEVGQVKGGETFARDALDLAHKATERPRTWLVEAWNPGELRSSPMLAGGASVLLPGAGQFYNGQWAKGGAYMASSLGLLSISLAANGEESRYFHGSLTGPDALRLGAAMLYGASIADAAYNAQRLEAERPFTGVTLSSAAAWSTQGTPGAPTVAGLTVEWVPQRSFSLALERVGWTSVEPGQGAWGFGGRAAWSYAQGRKLRPTVFVGAGLRYARTPLPEDGGTDTLSPLVGDWQAAEDGTRRSSGMLSPTVGGGLGLRWYVTPRYFVEWESRLETDGGAPELLLGGGVGVHFGR